LVEAGEATATLDRYGAWILGRNPGSSTPSHRVDKVPPGRAAPASEHPMVTVLAVDAVGFMPMAERLGEEETEAILRGCFAHMTDAVRRHEGTIARFLGDGFLTLFGAPIAHKDSARRAVGAALEMQRALDAYADEVLRRLGLEWRFRIGLATGPVDVGKVGDDLALDYTAIGDAANLAVRLQRLGEPGAVYLSEQTYRAVRDDVECEPLGGLRVKGRAAPVVGYRAIREK
jgi:adenylate cyclase